MTQTACVQRRAELLNRYTKRYRGKLANKTQIKPHLTVNPKKPPPLAVISPPPRTFSIWNGVGDSPLIGALMVFFACLVPGTENNAIVRSQDTAVAQETGDIQR